jgi:hypothetical protein
MGTRQASRNTHRLDNASRSCYVPQRLQKREPTSSPWFVTACNKSALQRCYETLVFALSGARRVQRHIVSARCRCKALAAGTRGRAWP